MYYVTSIYSDFPAPVWKQQLPQQQISPHSKCSFLLPKMTEVYNSKKRLQKILEILKGTDIISNHDNYKYLIQEES